MKSIDAQEHFPSRKRTPEHYYAISSAIKKFSGGSDMDYARLEKAGLSRSEIKKFNTLMYNYNMKRGA
jgi:hypothetical protein